MNARLRCTWYEPTEEPSARLLIPGCMERVQDPDADCTCPTTGAELRRLQQENAALAEKLTEAQRLFSDLNSAVAKHTNAAEIYQVADQATSERLARQRHAS